MIIMMKEYERKHNIKILYFVKFGSHLYGTNTKQSDTDYKGLFLPSKESCFLNNQPKHISFTTGHNYSKNNSEDIDFELWSLQYWLKLLQKGDTNAIDLLYSYSHPEVLEYCDPEILPLFQSHNKLFDINKCKGYAGYIKGQVKKYGIKGERVGVYKRIYEYVEKNSRFSEPGAKLKDYIYPIVSHCYNKSFCFIKSINNQDCLVLCGKVHMGSIFLEEFYDRVKKEYEKFGHRARLAEQNQGIDWKAVSHALRAVYQMLELIRDGEIKFPLAESPYLTKIKQGLVDWKILSKQITNGLEEIDTNTPGQHQFYRDDNFIKKIVLNLYK